MFLPQIAHKEKVGKIFYIVLTIFVSLISIISSLTFNFAIKLQEGSYMPNAGQMSSIHENFHHQQQQQQQQQHPVVEAQTQYQVKLR